MLRIWAWSPSSTVAIGGSFASRVSGSGQALLEQGTFGGVAGQAEGALVGPPGLHRAAELAQQFGAGCVIKVIAVQLSGEGVGRVEGRLGSQHLAEGDGPVQPGYW